MPPSHAQTVDEVLRSHNVDPAKGLTTARVLKLREEHGRNELDKEEGTPLWKVCAHSRVWPLALAPPPHPVCTRVPCPMAAPSINAGRQQLLLCVPLSWASASSIL